MLWNGFACSGATLAKHRWEVSCLRVDLLFTSGFSRVTLEGVWVNYCFDFGFPVVDHVIGGGEIAPLKGVLSGPMPCEQVMLDAALTIDHRPVVVSILSLSKDHFTRFGCVLVDSGRGSEVELRSLLTDTRLALFLTNRTEYVISNEFIVKTRRK